MRRPGRSRHDDGRAGPDAVSAPSRDLARAGVVVSGALLASRILGWVRYVVIAASLGIDRDLDIYVAAFRIPDFLFQLAAAGALASTLIPTIATLVAAGERDRAWRVVSTVANLILLALAIVAAVTFVAAPVIAPLVAPGFTPEETAQLVDLTRILLLSPIFLALSVVAGSVLNSAGRFAVSVTAPIVYNVVIIAAAVLFVPTFGLAALAWGTVAGAAANLLVQLPAVLRHVGFVFTPRIDLHDAEARRTLVLLGPRAIGLAGSQLTLLVLTMIASTLPAGSIGAFALAFAIFQIPLGVVAYPLGVVALPALSTRFAEGRLDAYVNLVAGAVRLLGFTMLPAACIGAALALPIIGVVIDVGAVDDAGVALTGAAFLGLLAALPSEANIIVLSRAFFAARNTWIPVGAALVTVATSVAIATLLVDALGILGIALGVTAASWVEAILLLVAFRSRHRAFDLAGLARAHGTYLAGALVAGLAALGVRDVLAGAGGADAGWARAMVSLAAGAAAGLAVYVVLMAALRVPELGRARQLVRRGLGRRPA